MPASGSKNINTVSKISQIVIRKSKNLKVPLENTLAIFKNKLNAFKATLIQNAT